MKKLEKIHAERILEAVNEFTGMVGGYDKIEVTLWDMLYGSLTNPDLPTEHHQNDEMLFLFRRLTELLKAIQPIDPPRVKDFCKN